MRLHKLFLLVFLTSISCTGFNSKEQEPLAKVYSNYLYKDDLVKNFPSDIDEDDSIRLARHYIDKWIRDQLFLKLAENNLPDREKNLEKEIAEFRASLLVYKYQQYLISQKLDSVISEDELEKYYEVNSHNFILDKPAIRGVFMKVPVDAPDRDRLLSWFRNDDQLTEMENYRNLYAADYSWFNENWVFLDEVLVKLPNALYNPSTNISNIDNIRVSDAEYHYFIGIKEYKAPRSPMPFSLASQKIKSIILNKRKIQFLNELEKNVFTEGLSKNAYQYY